MSDPFFGEVRIFAFKFAPTDWALCNGQQVAINQNAALYSLLQNTYGSDLKTYFCLPNMQGTVPMATGQGKGLTPRTLGKVVGSEYVTLNSSQVASHNHTVNTALPANNSLLQNTPAANLTFGPTINQRNYETTPVNPTAPPATLNPLTLTSALGNTASTADPHENRQPFLVMNFCICTNGVYPQRPN